MTTYAQPSFQGKIEYDVRMRGETLLGKLILSFGVNKIRMELIIPDKTSDNNYNLIDLGSGKIYTMNVRDKSYEVKLLHKKEEPPVLPSKEIAGYKTTALFQQQNKKQTEDDFLFSLSNGIFYTADDLYYFVPKVYEGNPQLLMVKNSKVVLGYEISFSNKQWNLNNTVGWGIKDGFVTSAMATLIIAAKVDPALFTIPAGYSEKGIQNPVDDETSPIQDSSNSMNAAAKKEPGTFSSKPSKKKIPVSKGSSVPRKKD